MGAALTAAFVMGSHYAGRLDGYTRPIRAACHRNSRLVRQVRVRVEEAAAPVGEPSTRSKDLMSLQPTLTKAN